MEQLLKLLEWLRTLPMGFKILTVLIVLLVAIILVFTSCSVSQQTVVGDSNTTTTNQTVTVDSLTLPNPNFIPQWQQIHR